MKRILITGGSGFLGTKMREAARGKYNVYFTYQKTAKDKFSKGFKCDIIDRNKVFETIGRIKPFVIIHAAAVTDVDLCEKNRELAWKVNVGGTKNIIDACSKYKIKLIFVSTSYVFDGKKGNYRETDTPQNPANYYSETKLEAERQIIASNINYAIGRTVVLYGWGRPNFVTWVLSEIKKKNRIRIATDLYTSPTYINNCADALLRIAEKDAKGIFHITGNERISRYDFVLKIGKVFKADMSSVEPIMSSELGRSAVRAKDTSLSTKFTEKVLGIRMLNTTQGLSEMKKDKTGYNLFLKHGIEEWNKTK